MKGKRYPKEFKEQLIQEAQEIGNVLQVAKRHEISPRSCTAGLANQKAWQHTSGLFTWFQIKSG